MRYFIGERELTAVEEAAYLAERLLRDPSATDEQFALADGIAHSMCDNDGQYLQMIGWAEEEFDNVEVEPLLLNV